MLVAEIILKRLLISLKLLWRTIEYKIRQVSIRRVIDVSSGYDVDSVPTYLLVIWITALYMTVFVKRNLEEAATSDFSSLMPSRESAILAT